MQCSLFLLYTAPCAFLLGMWLADQWIARQELEHSDDDESNGGDVSQ